MDITITIKTDNAAFEENEGEVSRILYKLAGQFQCLSLKSEIRLHLIDLNGNTVGECVGKP